MADVPPDGFGGIFQTYSRANSSWLAVYQNYFDRITVACHSLIPLICFMPTYVIITPPSIAKE